jgi:hypothetical protein
VTHLAYLRTTGGRVLGYGTIRVKSAGQKQETGMIGYLPKPEAVFDAIRELIVGVES